MKTLLRKLILIFICLMPFVGIAQEAKSKDSAPASTRAKRKIAGQQWKEQRKTEMEQKKAVKAHHKRLQTKETRKEMRNKKRKSEKLRANKKDFFLIRWFKYRH